MAIQALIRSQHKFTEQEVLEYVKRSGVQLIELVHNTNAMHRERARGFDDVVMEVSREGQTRIKYSTFGCADFKPNKFGQRIAWVPRTKRNLRVLAACYRDNVWTIVDAITRAEIKKVSDKTPVTQKEIEWRRKSKEHPIGGAMVEQRTNNDETLNQEEMRKIQEENRKLKSENLELLQGRPDALDPNFDPHPAPKAEISPEPEGPKEIDMGTLDPPDEKGKPDPTANLSPTDDPPSDADLESLATDEPPPVPTPYAEMQMKQLQATCKLYEIKMPAHSTQAQLIDLLNKEKPIGEPAKAVIE